MTEPWDEEIDFKDQSEFFGYRSGFVNGMTRTCQDLIQGGIVSKEEMEAEMGKLVKEDEPDLRNQYEREGYETGLREGSIFTCVRMVHNNRLTVRQAAETLGVTEDDFEEFYTYTLDIYHETWEIRNPKN